MDQTFMTIHNLSPDANILFVSESVSDILGYQPSDVQGKPAFDYFHPEEVPFARSVHSRGILLDKAAVLHYARIQSKERQWVSCECCFTIVHDVLVACTSIYRRGEKSERRAIEAPQIRRIFSSSPRDPRYNMLEHLSPKFKMPPMEREPRAALILNRFTRTLTVMFATNAISPLLGLSAEEIKDKSFYECIQENCLGDAIRCLESAKANESIAYLRFWYRDPRQGEFEENEQEEVEEDDENDDADMSNIGISNHDGFNIDEDMDIDDVEAKEEGGMDYSNAFTPYGAVSRELVRAASPSRSPRPTSRRPRRREPASSFELEAVVSCTSDGLVVVLRRARPPIPAPHPPLLSPFDFENGLFAAPWGQQPIRPYYPPEMLYTFRPPLLPQFMPLRENVKAAGGPPLDQLMMSIRDVAVFAWALCGINGNLAAYARGLPRGEAQPHDGLPIWDPSAGTEAAGPSYPTANAHLGWNQQQLSRGKMPSTTGAVTSPPPYPPAVPSLYPPEPSSVVADPHPSAAFPSVYNSPIHDNNSTEYTSSGLARTLNWQTPTAFPPSSASTFDQPRASPRPTMGQHPTYRQPHEQWHEAGRPYSPPPNYTISTPPPKDSTEPSRSFRPWQ
ncbi:hypothetical protein MKZ38_005843 [Zalerion maritima]|uniref:PAS domain-containing protein n=1 Tax=Zalerion maritima TaxID=339359 RepID=A0AAD5WQ13_9PEZI|nr:hypothetical protein MKZ38_005843 [Zalerion maritima]